MAGDAIGDRMKGYERTARMALPGRLPVVVRVDGKAFHTYCKGLARPFDERFMEAMDSVCVRLCKEMQGAALGFVQSDEISILLHGYKRLASKPWFDNEVQKVVSVSASIAAAVLTQASAKLFGEVRLAFFDARVFVLPESEVCNYFIWRQQDAIRNSIQMVAQSLFSQRELHGKDTRRLQEMILQKSGEDWSALAAGKQRGRGVVRKVSGEGEAARSRWIVEETPIFTENRTYVEQHLAVDPEISI